MSRPHQMRQGVGSGQPNTNGSGSGSGSERSHSGRGVSPYDQGRRAYGNANGSPGPGGQRQNGQRDGRSGAYEPAAYGAGPRPVYSREHSDPVDPLENRRPGYNREDSDPIDPLDTRGGSNGQQMQPPPRNRQRAPSPLVGDGVVVNGRGPRTAGARLDDVLQVIREDWDFMSTDTCVPVQIALSLSDSSSLGRAGKLRAFQDTRHDLELALQAIVNEHHQGFNSSIGTYHSIMRSITNSQLRVRSLREKLLLAKKDLTGDKPEVKNLAIESQRYEDMLQILSAIEILRGIPEKLDLRISEKRFLTAVELLSESLKNINKPEMKEIAALQDLRRNLENQEASLADILVEELHSHLYLKSPYCDVRWKSYQAMKEGKVAGLATEAQGLLSSGSTKRAFQHFLETEDLTTEMVEDASRNIEAESLHYIRLLIESLHRLGHLPSALEEISQRLPVELNKVVDKTNQEVDNRHPESFRGKSQSFKDGKSIDLCLSETDPRVDVLYDLLYTLYSKFESILEGYRVIHDVVKGISKRNWSKESTTTSMSGGFLEVWKLIQSEIRSLLHDYLTANESRTTSNAPKSLQNSVNSILNAKAGNKNQQKKIFKLERADATNSGLKENQDDLELILKANVPGLVSDSSRPVETVTESSATDGSATGRKLLVEPTVFNMGHLLSPSLAFLQIIKDIVPAGLGVAQSTFTSFLDDFLVNVFLPQLDDTLRELSNQTTGDLDAFQQDPIWASVAQRPVMKGTSAFYSLITAICRMLDSIPHDQAFSQLIVDLLTAYYDKCFEFYKELVMRDSVSTSANERAMKKSAEWTQSGDLANTLRLMLEEQQDMGEYLLKETLLLTRLKGDTELAYSDIITERKTVFSLCILYNSMKWLSTKITELRRLSEQDNDLSRRENGNRTRRWTLVEEAQRQRNGTSVVYLPLTNELINAFDGVVNTFNELANTVLFTLRTEARCHIAFHLGTSMKYGNFSLDNEPSEPDTSAMALNSDLVWFDEDISTLLRHDEQEFIKTGMGLYMDHLLITGCGQIKTMNQLGVEKIQLSILVLQQNLKNIVGDAKLERSADFYKLFRGGPQNMIVKAKDGTIGYTYDELKQLVNLWYSESLLNNGKVQARRSLNDDLIELSELLWEK